MLQRRSLASQLRKRRVQIRDQAVEHAIARPRITFVQRLDLRQRTQEESWFDPRLHRGQAGSKHFTTCVDALQLRGVERFPSESGRSETHVDRKREATSESEVCRRPHDPAEQLWGIQTPTSPVVGCESSAPARRA